MGNEIYSHKPPDAVGGDERRGDNVTSCYVLDRRGNSLTVCFNGDKRKSKRDKLFPENSPTRHRPADLRTKWIIRPKDPPLRLSAPSAYRARGQVTPDLGTIKHQKLEETSLK